MKEITRCSDKDYLTLVEIWERSVRVTHFFLREEDIIEIKSSLVPLYFPNVDLYSVSDNGRLTGFIGLNADVIEMLFVDSKFRGRGYGSLLIDFAKQRGATKVDVNEQNVSAFEFYKTKGFRLIGRDETDESGRPYPILHLSL
ncbi:MAG: GNAT family N-acetyltransferase [Duncaniella sp.]|nr:GNAT family N-acetyltransferase [Duncaniella sp.]MDE6573377.1 GNAT family N-acetyltransferase [Duncaniella sp.]